MNGLSEHASISECPHSFGEFFRERGDEGLRKAVELRRHVRALVCEAADEVEDGVGRLSINPEDASLAIHERHPRTIRNSRLSRRQCKSRMSHV